MWKKWVPLGCLSVVALQPFVSRKWQSKEGAFSFSPFVGEVKNGRIASFIAR
jgi:hypothetical protein